MMVWTRGWVGMGYDGGFWRVLPYDKPIHHGLSPMIGRTFRSGSMGPGAGQDRQSLMIRISQDPESMLEARDQSGYQSIYV